MNGRVWKSAVQLVLLLLLQVVALGGIHLFGYATPIVIAWLPMHTPRRSPHIPRLLWAFAMGLLFDMFSNTMGMGMATCTLMAMLQPMLLEAFTPRNAPDDMLPSPYTMGTMRYLLYTLVTMLLFHAVFYALDAFTLTNWRLTALGSMAAALVATLLVALLQWAIGRRK